MTFSDKFIAATAEYATYDRRVPAPAFRRTFTVDEAKEATLTGHRNNTYSQLSASYKGRTNSSLPLRGEGGTERDAE